MPGRTVEWLEVSRLASGMLLRVPVWTVRGTGAGPALGVTAAIHGDEIVGIEVVRRLLDRLERTPFRGMVRAVPVATRWPPSSSSLPMPSAASPTPSSRRRGSPCAGSSAS